MDKNNKLTTSRRDAIKDIFKKGGLMALGGFPWAAYVDENKEQEFVLRPPGAVENKEFLKTCIKCGICVKKCPYDTLKLAKTNDDALTGTPFFTPREIPCYMCTDIPCVEACPTDSLLKELVSNKETGEYDINEADMGVAVLDQNNCLAYWGIRCDACFRACPLMNEAIILNIERNERTGKHAMLKPVVNIDSCTGCGMCEHACITENPAIVILPREKALGKVSDDYIKGWDKSDESRIDTSKVYIDKNEVEESTLDYLNDSGSLFDE